MGEKDVAQKNFMACDDVFADIVNGTLFDGEQVIKPGTLQDAVVLRKRRA